MASPLSASTLLEEQGAGRTLELRSQSKGHESSCTSLGDRTAPPSLCSLPWLHPHSVTILVFQGRGRREGAEVGHVPRLCSAPGALGVDIHLVSTMISSPRPGFPSHLLTPSASRGQSFGSAILSSRADSQRPSPCVPQRRLGLSIFRRNLGPSPRSRTAFCCCLLRPQRRPAACPSGVQFQSCRWCLLNVSICLSPLHCQHPDLSSRFFVFVFNIKRVPSWSHHSHPILLCTLLSPTGGDSSFNTMPVTLVAPLFAISLGNKQNAECSNVLQGFAWQSLIDAICSRTALRLSSGHTSVFRC